MKVRAVIKLGVALSVILFCIGIAFYGFARLSMAEEESRADVFEFVPQNCAGILEADNIDNFMRRFSQAAYSSRLDTLHRSGLLNDILNGLNRYSSSVAHGLSRQMNQVVVSFHYPHTSKDVVAYFRTGEDGKRQLIEAMRGRHGTNFVSKHETYRGRKIEIYPLAPTKFLSVYTTEGLVAVSYQKKLIEQVIDAEKERRSLRQDDAFTSIYHAQPADLITIYGRTASVPFLGKDSCESWSEFDIHLNSEVFYLSGKMNGEDADCLESRLQAVHALQTENEPDSLLVVAGCERVDSCVSKVMASPSHSLFDECVSNLSHDASYIMVADMDKIADSPERFASYLPPFIIRHADLFRSFILSVQFTKVDNHLSHIFVFTYKE